MNNTLTLTLNHPLTESDWGKICDVELEKTKHIWFETPSGKRVDFIRADILDVIRAEIEEYRSTIDYAISEDELKIEGMKEAYADCLETIDKYRIESEGNNADSD